MARMRALRGGCWAYLNPVPAAYRARQGPAGIRGDMVGFRIAVLPPRFLFKFHFFRITMTTSNHTISATALNLPMVSIAPGRFMMGSDSPSAFSDEKPVHEVIIDKGFEMAETPTLSLIHI